MRRVVLVVGASSGIGAATVERLAAAGDVVIGVARSEDGLRALRRRTRGVETRPADVLDADAIDGVVADVVAQHGRLDAVVHTAQVMAYGRFDEVPVDAWDRVIATAVHGTANVARPVLKQMRRQGQGTFVVVGSLLGTIAVPGMGAYVTAKWAQHGMVRTLRLENRDVPGVAICTLVPGAIDTPIYAQAAHYGPHRGRPPAPVLTVERAARRVERLLDHPRRSANVGPLNLLTEAGFRLVPAVYDRLVGPLAARFAYPGPDVAPDDGNVFASRADGEGPSGGWSFSGRRASPRSVR